jgi:hypothetical protein
LTDCALKRLDRPTDVLSLFGRAELVVLDPAPSVAADVVARGGDGFGGRRIALECEGAPVDRHRHIALGECAQDAPEARSAAVFVDRLDREVASFSQASSEAGLRQDRLRRAVPVRDRIFGTFFVVQHEVDCQPCTARPFRIGRLAAVADHLAWIRFGHVRRLPHRPSPLHLEWRDTKQR